MSSFIDSLIHDIYLDSVVTKADVPDFDPLHLNAGVHDITDEFFDDLLMKLVNAEQACYKSDVFLNLEQRTRLSMLSQVSNTLLTETNKYLKPGNTRGSSVDENTLSFKDKGLLNNVRSLLMKRNRSKSFLSPNSSLELKPRPSLTIPQQSVSSNNLLSPTPQSTLDQGNKLKNHFLSTGEFKNMNLTSSIDDMIFRQSVD